MLTAIGGGKPDRVPLSFMIFQAMKLRSNDWRDAAEQQIALGMDPMIDLTHVGLRPTEYHEMPGIPVHLGPGVSTREFREAPPAGERYGLLHRQYITPAGTLTCTVAQTDDWPYGDHVPFLNDYIEPRARAFPVRSPEDLPALKYLLAAPTAEDVQFCRDAWDEPKKFAAQRGLLLAGGWGVGVDAAAWLMGLTNALMAGLDQPEFLDGFLEIIHQWSCRREELVLEHKVDLFIRRAWYEGTSFWSPDLYRRFLLPRLAKEVRLAHQAGAKFGYIVTAGSLQFLDLIIEAGVDVIMGVEDVQDHGMDYAALKARVARAASPSAGRVGLWGGVNGFVTIEQGSDEDVVAATTKAVETLGPDGFILAPVDNVRNASEAVWRRIMLFVQTWKKLTEKQR
jgi:hypothetical protein